MRLRAFVISFALVTTLACNLTPTPDLPPVENQQSDKGSEIAEVVTTSTPAPTPSAEALDDVEAEPSEQDAFETDPLQAAASIENGTVTGVYSIELLGTSAYINSLDVLVFTGAFRNAADETFGNYRLQISLYDEAGTLIAEQTGFPDFRELEPGELTGFSAFFDEETQVTDFASFEIRPEADVPNQFVNQSRDLTLTDVRGGPGAFTDYEIEGTVTNNRAKAVELVKISAVMFDAEGNFVGTAFGFSELSELQSGASSPFGITVFRALGAIDNFELNVQASITDG